jgi:DNA-binding XRE family transcriptional regulator
MLAFINHFGKFSLTFNQNGEYNINQIGKGGETMKLSEKQVLETKRKRGELNLKIVDLANTTGINRHTLGQILNHKHRNVTKSTFYKLNNWLIEQYTTLK